MALTENYQLLKEIKMGYWYYNGSKLGTLYYRLYAKYNADTQKATLNTRVYNDGTWCESGNCYNEINGNKTIDNEWWTFYKGETDVGELTIDLTSKTSITARFKCYGLDSKWFSITLDIEPPFDKAIGLDFDIGSATNITITRYNESYTRTVVASIGTFKETLLDKGTDTQIAWQPDADDLYKQVPNTNTGTITLTTTTYNGDTIIGTAISTLKCRVTDSNPVVEDVTITDSLAIVASNVLVRYLSKPKFEINAKALNGASISTYSVTEQNSTEKTSTSNVITAENIVANNSFSIKVTDSRGNSTTATFSASKFIEYVLPAIAKLDLARTGENLDQIQASISGVWFNQSINGTANKLTLKYRYKTGIGEYSEFINIPETATGSQFIVETLLAPAGGFDVNSVYTIEVIATDNLTDGNLSGLVGKAIPLIDHWNENDKDYYNINAEIQQHGEAIFKNQKILWEDAWYMHATQIAELSEKISEQIHGIILVFSGYSDGAAGNWNWTSQFISKKEIELTDGAGHLFLNGGTSGANSFKYIYIYDDRLEGNDCNILQNDTYDNKACVLRYVIGV